MIATHGQILSPLRSADPIITYVFSLGGVIIIITHRAKVHMRVIIWSCVDFSVMSIPRVAVEHMFGRLSLTAIYGIQLLRCQVSYQVSCKHSRFYFFYVARHGRADTDILDSLFHYLSRSHRFALDDVYVRPL